MSYSFAIKKWVKTSQAPQARLVFKTVKALRAFEVPAPKAIFKPAYLLHSLICSSVKNVCRIFVWTPLFKSQMQSCGKRIYLYGGLPYLAGGLQICVGDNCRISGKTTITGRSSSAKIPALLVGNNVDIGWQTTIAVGRHVVLGNNVRIAGQCFLAGYPGHPLNAQARAAGKPEQDHQVGDIVLEDDVWLATGVSVMAGVTIGKGTVVAASSVVTRSLPSGVLAAGNPAKIIRQIEV